MYLSLSLSLSLYLSLSLSFFSVRSCLLISLIKCLEGQKSLGSLCSVVKTLIVSGAGPSKQGTRSPIELSWTAKNEWHSPKYVFACYCRCLRITPMKPPGGESKLNLKEDEDGELPEEELEERCVR